MGKNENSYNRRSYLKTTGLATAAMVSLAGCLDGGDEDVDEPDVEDEAELGSLSVILSDNNEGIDGFESLTLIIDGIWVQEEYLAEIDAENQSSESVDEFAEDGIGREYFELNNSLEMDIASDETGLVEIANIEIPVGHYRYVQFDIQDINATLDDGSLVLVETEGNSPIQFEQQYEVRGDTMTEFFATVSVEQDDDNNYTMRPSDDFLVTYDGKEY